MTNKKYTPESECFTIGSLGACDITCPVYKEGQCPEPDAMLDRLNEEEAKLHREIYGGE